MGLLDILNGMQNGPRGQRQPSSVDSSSGKGGGMSPMMMALLGLLAYKALKGRGSQPVAPDNTAQPIPLPPGGTVAAGNPGGGIGDNSGLARVRTVLMPSDPPAIIRWHQPTPDETLTTYREPVPEG